MFVVSNVRVVAKDGAVRRVGASRNPGSDQDYSTFEKHADTYLTDSSYESDPDYSTERKGYGSGDTYDYASKVKKGTTIYFKTTVDASKRGDFYKIYKEYPDDTTTNPVTKRRIICSFKFRTKKNNDKPNTVTPSSYAAGTGNGWEVLTNYEGQPVDIFGKIITDSRYNTVAKIEALNHSGMVHVISQDYKNNCAGHYATEWAVYDTSNNYKKQIIPSALVINENNIRRSNTPSGLYDFALPQAAWAR